jgi:hypothetical protein
MPRFKLQEDKVFFEMLFELLTFQTEVYKEAWRMLKMLNTRLEKFWTLLWLDNVPSYMVNHEKFSWDRLFKTENLHETMYVLEILESFLVNDYMMLGEDCEERKLRDVWINKFIQLGGFVELVKLSEKASLIADEATQEHMPGNETNAIKKTFLEQLLRIISIFVMGAYHAQKPEEEAVNLTTLKRNQSKPETQTFVAAKEDTYTSPEKGSGIPFVNAANDVMGPHLPNSKGGDVDPTMITQEYLFGAGETS